MSQAKKNLNHINQSMSANGYRIDFSYFHPLFSLLRELGFKTDDRETVRRTFPERMVDL